MSRNRKLCLNRRPAKKPAHPRWSLGPDNRYFGEVGGAETGTEALGVAGGLAWSDYRSLNAGAGAFAESSSEARALCCSLLRIAR